MKILAVLGSLLLLTTIMMLEADRNLRDGRSQRSERLAELVWREHGRALAYALRHPDHIGPIPVSVSGGSGAAEVGARVGPSPRLLAVWANPGGADPHRALARLRTLADRRIDIGLASQGALRQADLAEIDLPGVPSGHLVIVTRLEAP